MPRPKGSKNKNTQEHKPVKQESEVFFGPVKEDKVKEKNIHPKFHKFLGEKNSD